MVLVSQSDVGSILNRASGFIGGYDFTINPYRGCSFGCSYCYAARHLYDKNLEQTWGQWVMVKANAPALLRRAARAGKFAHASIYMATVTDPYLPQERQFRVTEQCLRILQEFPPRRLVIQTRGPLIERDIEILKSLGDRAIVSFSLPTDDDDVRKLFEPVTASIPRRLKTIYKLSENGVRVYATVAPVLPCDPARLSASLRHAVEGVIISGFYDDGAGGRNTLPSALRIIHERGWGYCLEPGYARVVAEKVKELFGPNVHCGKDAFTRLSHV